MRLLFLGINYWPEQTGNATFVIGRCEYLASQGHEVTICTGFPYYPEWKIPAKYRGRLSGQEVHHDVRIIRSYLYVPQRVTAVRRILHEASFIASSLFAALRRQKPDLIYVVSAPLGLAASAYLLSRWWRVPYAFYVSDMQPDAAADLGMLPKPVMECLYALERFAYRNAALVPTLTEGMRQRIISKGVPPEKVVVFSHCADQVLFKVPMTAGGKDFRREHDLDDRFVVLHSGNMGVKQGLDVVIDAALRTANDPAITYLLVGDGVARPALEGRAKGLDLTNVRFLPVQPKETFWEMLGATDVCLITERASVGDVLFPGKTIDFLAAGRPVIASMSPRTEAARIIGGQGAGLVVEPENGDALASAVMQVRSDDNGRREMGERGRAYAREHWDRNRILPVMEAKLASLIQAAKCQERAASVHDGGR